MTHRTLRWLIHAAGLPLAAMYRLGGAVRWLALLTALLTCAPAASAGEWLYTVRPGDNLWNIAEAHLSHMRYVEPLRQLNDIADPHRLQPGSRLRIPLAWVRLEVTGAEVIEARGHVSARRGTDGSTHIVSRGFELQMGDTLLTSDDGSATVEFGDGSRMLVAPDSEVVFDLLQAYGESGFVDTRVRLKSGRTEHRTEPRRRGPEYEIITPAATTAVRGTRYRVGLVRDQATAAEVLEGRIELTAASAALEIPAGFGVIATRDEPPAPARPLLPAPDLAHLPRRIRRIPIHMTLGEVTEATNYRVQIADTEKFESLRIDRLLQKPQLRGLDLPDGDYVLRQRGVDADGLEGTDGHHPFTVDARPVPPISLGPANSAVLQPGPVELRWAEPQGADRYHLQVATAPDFAAPLVDRPDWRETHYELPADLAPGVYHWRLASRTVSGKTGPFGDPLQFKRLAVAPALEQAAIDDDSVSLRWVAGLPGDRYVLQIARDAGFEDLLLQSVVDEPAFELPRPAAGIYFLRVRTLDRDGDAGPFGPAQRMTVPPDSIWPFLVPFMVILL